MKLDTIHHIAIIGRDRDAMLHFYVDQLGFAIVSEYDRPERGDILINLRQGQLTLELFIKSTAPERPKFPLPEHAGLRHLAFKVDDVETYLAKFDQLGIENTGLRYDDFDGKKMAFFFDPEGLPLEIHE